MFKNSGPNDTHTDLSQAEKQERSNAGNTGTAVRLLVDCCHGAAGQVVSVSNSRAHDLVADGRAEVVK
jgi:hypothetical protein